MRPGPLGPCVGLGRMGSVAGISSNPGGRIAVHGLVYHGSGKKDWETVPDPSVVEPTDAVIRVDAVTICGTDLHILGGDVPEVEDCLLYTSPSPRDRS